MDFSEKLQRAYELNKEIERLDDELNESLYSMVVVHGDGEPKIGRIIYVDIERAIVTIEFGVIGTTEHSTEFYGRKDFETGKIKLTEVSQNDIPCLQG